MNSRYPAARTQQMRLPGSTNETANAPDVQSLVEGCEDDRCQIPLLPLWHCVDCDNSYCSRCWSLQGPHRPNKRGRDGIPHERQDLQVVRPLRTILSPPKDAEEIRELHQQDEQTKWFGVVRDLTGRPVLEDYGRYATLMSDVEGTSDAASQFPQLVSFIGVTNAGKSSLIKMLIQYDGSRGGISDNVAFPSPVVGSVLHDSVPTSGDVHLYADPSTHQDEFPVLYADCEGFEGGEKVPLGSLSRKRARRLSGMEEESAEAVIRSRLIQWAGTEESRRREFAVTALYPRLLYTFSDCVVFVLRNPKTFQSSVLTKLLDWGATAMEKSLNQPALPHCVVVLNYSDPGIHEREWDIDYATQSLLSTVNGALDYIEGVPRFRELASHWRCLGRHIYTVEDLILRYYSSFKVVRIPAQPQYKIMNEQIGKLHAVIRESCKKSFRAKHDARMLIGADELNTYLQSGFDHFTTHLDVPFNFMQVSLLHNPIPSDFGGHILQLCATLSAHFSSQRTEAVREMFERLSVFLASCVLLDCARFRKGRLNELFARYERFFDEAMAGYLELHCPCSYRSPDGSRACVLVKAGHLAKGHQDERGIIAAGDHIAAFDWRFAEHWKGQLRTAIEGVQRDFAYEVEQLAQATEAATVPEERIALDLHLEIINHFYQCMGPATRLFSHATCFCCLMDVPEHVLPCGHVLCDKCVQTYGRRRKRSVSMSCCPLHRNKSQWTNPAIIRYKPAGAGIRVLSLDGGGIRGVVQLEILRAIENALGGHMPVQMFFDLMVGTGTGGLIAVALRMDGQSVERCLDMFPAICEHAYIPRLPLAPKSQPTPRSKRVALLRQIVKAFYLGPRYKTGPLYAALRMAFTSQNSFFGSSGQFASGAKVAVTSASAARGNVTVHANYRRSHDSGAGYSFERTHDPTAELKTWECVGATMADPTYFKPFVSRNKTYLDGGVRCTNPVVLADKEAQRTWLDVKEPDICLSLGTGQHRRVIAEKLRDGAREVNPLNLSSSPNGSADEARKVDRKWRLGRGDDVLEAEREWQAFKAVATNERLHGKGLIRFNPDLGEEPPAPDRKDHLRTVQTRVRQILQEPHRRIAVENIAQRLVATSFYLDVRSQVTDEKGTQIISGGIACRFEDGSAELRAFGKVLDQRRKDGFEPFFLIRPVPCSIEVHSKQCHSRVTITARKITRMVRDAVFEQPSIVLRLEEDPIASSINLFLSAHNGLEPEGYPISGFPRGILRHSSDRASHSRPQASGRKNWRNQSGRESSVITESVLSQHPGLLRRSTVSNSSQATWSHSTGRAGSPIPPPGRWSTNTGTADEDAGMPAETRDAAHHSARSSYRRESRISLEANMQSRDDLPPTAAIQANREHTLPLDSSRPARLRTTRVVDEKGSAPDHTAVTQPFQLLRDPVGDGDGRPCSSSDSLNSACETVFEEDDRFYRDLVEEKSQATSVGDQVSMVRGSGDSDTLNILCGMYT